MTLPSSVEFKMDSVFRTYQTFTVDFVYPKHVEKTHHLYMREIDVKNNQVVLETVDPKKNFTTEQWKNIAKEYKIVVLANEVGGNVVLSVSEKFQGKIPLEGLKVLIETGEKISASLGVNTLRYYDQKSYGVLMNQYVQFFRFVPNDNKQKNQQDSIKK
jgi:hypothetical protein